MALGLPSTLPVGMTGSTVSVRDVLASGQQSYSFEFFPPRTDEGERVLWQALRRLESLAPTFVSVTYGAGGSTRDRTVAITRRIASDTTLRPVAHLTCVGSTVAELRQIMGRYADAGVRDVLALRGDPPGGLDGDWKATEGGLAHADELIALVRSLGGFCIGTAAFPEGHPESADLEADAAVLAGKARAGAEFAITQFFFDVDHYLRLRERAHRHGCHIPIIPGLMPVTDVRQIKRFVALSGAAFPAALAARLEAVADDPDAVHAMGVEVAVEMGARLLAEGAPGLHFYTLNRSTSTIEVYHALGLSTRVAAPV